MGEMQGIPPHWSVRGKGGAVSTANSLATEAGISILRQGGNAIDALLAVQWVLAVVEPQSSGLGGGG
ncbi:MAG: gamma-glutamyltransferase, partial [Spirochaetes bacterium]|nr:gamma-glutamyltransferase [Spirochaetota bacterium]